MATNNSIGLNIELPIYNSNGSSFHGLVLHKCTYDSVVMSLGDKITGDVYYNGNTLAVTMQEYVELDGVKFVLVTPPTVVREGMVSENSQLNGMTKYSFVFYHPMYMLGNFPFTDVAVTSSEAKYLSESKKFTWIGYPDDFIAKVNKNLDGTEWIVEKSSRFPAYLDDQLSDVLSFDENTIADACKTFYDTWGAPYIVAKVESTEAAYANGKRFKVIFGLPSNEIYEDAAHQQSGTPYIFRFSKGVGLKNNSRTPRGNKIVTRIAGSGSENNIPYGYPQIPWYGDSRWDYTEYEGDTINYDSDGHVTNTPKTTAYPLYMGIVGGAYVKLIKHPFTRTNLMPSIYGQTLFNKVSPYLSDGTANPDYDPNTTLIDYYDAIATQEYPYPNPIVANAPSYESHQFEDIKPELGQNVAIVDAYPVNNDLTPASEWDDSIDDNGNYVQSYFKMQLPVLSFDLYACAAITQEMQINMRSGACLGCTFTIQVDWDDYKANFYDADGNFAPTGSQRDYTKYPDSSQQQITVVLQKETATFGTLMPNMYQYPVANDTFVVLGISLPLSYIESAEERLDGEMKSYMLENNVHYFDYPLKFDEAFLRNNPYILSQIRPNSVVRFQYGNDTMQLFVKQMSVKYGEGVLPKYDITLTDNVEVVLNRIGQVAEDVEKLASLIAILRQNYNRSVWAELEKKLSKTQDDTAAGYIRMLKGLQIGANFVPDILGEGGVLRMRQDGKVELVTDILYARMRAYFDSVVIREYRHESGNRIKSPAQGFNASRVENIKVVEGIETIVDDASEADFFRCYWRVDDGEKKAENQFIIGDLAFCEHSDIVNGSLVTKRYWRVVVGRNAGNTTTADGEAWIDISNAHDANGNPVMTTISWEGQGGATQTLSVKSFESSANSYPEAHDDICMLGCTTDTTRQGAIIEYVSGIDAPTYQIYQGLGADATNPYSLSGKNQIGFGYNSSTGRAYMNVYGDFRFGARPNTQGSYLEYNSQTGALNIKAHVEFTNTDQELDTLVQNHQRDDSYDDTEVRGLINGLQEQIDGQIETWFYNYSPVNVDASGAPTSNVPLNVAPYSDWTTDDDKIAHLGDTFTNNSTGYCWRFSRNGETNAFEWVIIEDSAVIAALQNAARAQDTADHKRRVFICDSSHQTPTPPYDAGDLWVNVKYPWATGATYNDEILKCVTSKASGSFAIADWSLANGYTAKLNNFVNNTYAPFVTNIQGQVDKKAETFRQATDPSTPWYEEDAETHEVITDTRVQHIGDLWMDISENGGNKTYIYQNTGSEETPVYEWIPQEVPDEVFDEIDGKAEIFVTKPTTYNERDMWIIESGTAAADIPTGCQVGDIVVSNHKRTNSYTKGDWSKKDRYTDDSKFNGYISAFLSGSGASGDSATAAAIQRAITTALGSALGSATLISGGLMLTSMIGMRQLTGSDPSSISDYTTWGGISGEYNANDETVQGGAKGHGIAAWYGGDMVDKQMLSDADIAAGWGETLPDESTNYRWARSLFRFDGSGYIADANIYWDKVGSMTIKNLQTIYGTQAGVSVDINTLSSLTGIFNTETKSGTGFTELLVKPQNAFSRLYLNRGAAVASYPSDGSINDYAVLNFAEMKARFVTIDYFRQLFRAFKPNETAGQADVEVQPNTIDATISNIKAMVGFWTEQYVSALGNSSDGGGGGASVLYGLNDVTPNATGDGVMGAQDGYVLTYNGTTNHWYAAATAETYVLPQATANALGGIKIGYSGTGKNYPIVLDNDGKAYVNVPWTDTTYDLSGYATQTWVYNGFIQTSDTEQTIASTIGSLAKGVVEFYRSNNGYSFIGFANNDGNGEKQQLGFIGFDSIGGLKYRTIDATYYTIIHSGNIGSQSVLSAAQLTTSRTLWGQSFNGTANISGAMTGVSSITMNGANYRNDIIIPADNYLRIIIDSSTETGNYVFADSFFSCFIAGDNSINLGRSDARWATIYGVNYVASTSVKIGNAYLTYDSTNNAIRVSANADGTGAANFYAMGSVSALGQGSDSGGGGQGDVTWALLASQATGGRTIHSSYISGTLAYYLPLSGGTLTGTTTIQTTTFGEQLTIKRNASGSASAIKYTNTDGVLGYIGILADGQVWHWTSDTSVRYKIWDEGNDGSGSGLDADLLDGQHASYFATASSLNNYVKLSATEQTIESTISSLDKGVIEFYRSYAGGKSMIGFANKDANGNKQTLGFIGFDSVGGFKYRTTGATYYTIWHSGNDGSGSGLDADLLDGQHGSYYATASSLNNYVTLATAQTISATKTFSTTQKFRSYDANIIEVKRTASSGGAFIDYYHNNQDTYFWRIGSSANAEVYFSKNGGSVYGYTFSDAGVIKAFSGHGLYLATDANASDMDIRLHRGQTDANSIVLTSGAFRPFVSAHTLISLGNSSSYFDKVYCTGVIKAGSSDSYVLTGGGSHKAVSDFLLKTGGTMTGTLTLSNAAYASQLIIYRDAANSNTVIKCSNSNDNIKGRCFGFAADASVDTAFYFTDNDASTKYWVVSTSTIGNYNAGSATKLKTSRTLWGQSFDGSANVSGALSSVSSITMNGSNSRSDIITSAGAQIRIRINNAVETASYAFTDTWFGGFAAANGLLSLGRDSGRWSTVYAQKGDFYSADAGILKLKRNNSSGGAYIDYYHANQETHYWRVGSAADNAWAVYYDGSTRYLNITSSGDTSLNGNFEATISSSSNRYVRVANSNGSVEILTSTNRGLYDRTNSRWIVYTNGTNVYTPVNFISDGGVTALSDARHKQVLSNTPLTVEQVAQMPAVLFRWTDGKHDNKIYAGTLAQDWQSTLPQAILKEDNAEGTLSFNYGVAALISAITTARKVVDHEKEIAQLKNRVKALEDENEMLKTKLIA